MIKVRMNDTGKIVEVERNQAHDLIDQGKANIVAPEPPSKQRKYMNRQMSSTSRDVKSSNRRMKTS